MHCLYRKMMLSLFNERMHIRSEYKLAKAVAGVKPPKDGAIYKYLGEDGFSGLIIFSPLKSSEDVFELDFGWSFRGGANFERDLIFVKEYEVNKVDAVIKRDAFLEAVSIFAGRPSSAWRLQSLAAKAIHVTSKMKEKDAIKYYDEIFNMELKMSEEELRLICEPVIDQMLACIDEYVTPLFREVIPMALLMMSRTDNISK